MTHPQSLPPEFPPKSKLCYISDEDQGYTRHKHGWGFTYHDTNGRVISDPTERQRITNLHIPPAWTEVWICPNPNGHILASGRDGKQRKQYIYHPEWQAIRGQHKFERLKAFGEQLPQLREQTETHLRQRGLTYEKVLALVIRLMEKTLIRVGNTYYMQHNDSYGLTTLQDEQVGITGKKIIFEFTGKSGIEHQIDLEEKRLATLVQACQEIPGHQLFQYYDEQGKPRTVGSGDVNDYLRQLTGDEFSAKDFRTWGASVNMIKTLAEMPIPESETMAKRQLKEAIKEVAKQLGNTVTVCRKYYIHPSIAEAYLNGKFQKLIAKSPEVEENPMLNRYESILLHLLKS